MFAIKRKLLFKNKKEKSIFVNSIHLILKK